MKAVKSGVLALVLAIGWTTVEASDWPRFRGPNGSGISDQTVPTAWSPTKNIKWKVDLPGPGVSSPIVVGDRLFVTCYTGYGLDRNDPGEMKNLKRHLICFNAEDGKKIWQQTVPAVLPEDPFSGIGIPNHGYASHSPVSDGKRVYVFFGKTGALAFDMEGKQLWKTSLGTGSDPWRWGSSASPILYKKLLIVTASAESKALVALDTLTGKEVWRQEAGGFDGLWGSPILVETKDHTELVLSVPREMWGFHPDTGKLLWYCEATPAEQVHSSAVTSAGVIYAFTGRGGGSVAVRAGGKDDVTQSRVLWSGHDSARFASPLIHQNRLYLVASNVVSCIDMKTGERLYQKRLGSSGSAPANGGQSRPSGRGGPGGRGGGRGFGGMDYASPVIAGDTLYYIKGTGETFVLKIGDSLEQVAVNRIAQEEGESFAATPAISNGSLFVRSNKRIYRIAE